MAKRQATADWIPAATPAVTTRFSSNTQKGKEPFSSTAGSSRARKTLYLRTDTIQAVEALAKDKGIGVSKLADFLLAQALEQIESGALKLPIKRQTVATLEY